MLQKNGLETYEGTHAEQLEVDRIRMMGKIMKNYNSEEFLNLSSRESYLTKIKKKEKEPA